MADKVSQIFSKPLQLADQISKEAPLAVSFRQDCEELKNKSVRLCLLLRQALRVSGDLYERPTRRIMDETEKVLEKALILVIKCKAKGIQGIFTIIPNGALKKINQQLENSIGDVSWLLRVSAPADDRDDEYLGLPPIAANEPILCLIWEQIAILCSGSVEERTDAAASLVSLARDNDRYGSLIIEEGGIPPLLKLAKEAKMEGQENAARAIGLLGRDPQSVEQIVHAGVCGIFAKMLKEGHMKVQVVVAWAVSELAAHHRKCQDHFAQTNTIRLLVSHLAFETIQEHSKYAIPTKQSILSVHSVVMASNNNGHDDKHSHNQLINPGADQPAGMHNLVIAMKNQKATSPNENIAKPNPEHQDEHHHHNQHHHHHDEHHHHHHHHHHHDEHHHHHHHHRHHSKHHDGLSGSSIKRRESEDPETKAEMKAMAARALRYLCAGNVTICRNITESRALLCLAVLLEKGPEDVQYHSAMALMEITGVAEIDSELRRSAFKPTAPVAKAVVDQFLHIIIKADSELLIPSIQSIGNLARTFRATETRFIGPLVNLLDDREPDVTSEVAIALNKFAGPDNFLHVNHCKSIISAGGTKHLIPLVYFGEQIVQIPCFILLCYIAMHVPDNESLAQEDVLVVLGWATKQNHLMQDKQLETLVYEATSRLDLYQARTKSYQ